MATITPTVTIVDDQTVRFTWANMTQSGSDVGAPIGRNHAQFADRSVQVSGTFGAAGNLAVKGSNDGGANFFVLNDQSDNALNITTAKHEEIVNITEQMRPEVTAGDGTTSLTVSIIARRNQRSK